MIKVYIQYPWNVSDSQYYRSLIEYPPEGIEYNTQKSQGMIVNPKKLFLINLFKKIVRGFLEKTKLPILNIHKTDCQENYDLIHCAHCLSKNTDKPWIFDVEMVWQLFISGRDTDIGKKRALKILMRDNCKSILAWTNDAKQEIVSKFPEIKDKIEVVSYAMPPPKFKKIKHKGINLLFVGRYFYEKGGKHTLYIFDKLTKKYENVKCLFVSQTPKEILEKYSSNKKIKFYDLMPHQKLMEEIFPKADIFVYLGYSDTYGFSFIEAMSFGLPIITADGHARKDIISEGKTGFIIPRIGHYRTKIDTHNFGDNEKKIIQGLIEKTSLLIENEELREKMSIDCIKTVRDGKFSIKERNEKLRRIYEEALR